MADYADLLAAENNKKPEYKPVLPAKPTPGKKETRQETNTPGQTSVRHDVTPSPRHDVNYRAWRDIIENTETLNSALRLTREERYEVEDMIQAECFGFGYWQTTRPRAGLPPDAETWRWSAGDLLG
jgi:hypothetical protein